MLQNYDKLEMLEIKDKKGPFSECEIGKWSIVKIKMRWAYPILIILSKKNKKDSSGA